MLGLGASLLYSSGVSSVESIILSLFKERVRQDSGSIEDGVCLDASFDKLDDVFDHRVIRSTFRKRVVAEGYVDDINCLTLALSVLDAAATRDKGIRNTFRNRVVADGGYVDDVNCLTTEIAGLI